MRTPTHVWGTLRVRQSDLAKARQRLLQLAGERSSEDVLCPRTSVPDSADRPIRGSLYQHSAVGIEVALGVTGEARVATPGEVFLLKPNQILVIPRGVFHAQLASHLSREHTVSWLHLDGSRAHMGDSAWGPAGRPVPGMLKLDRALELNGRTNVESIGSAIVNELGSRDWGYHQAAAGLLRYLVCILIRRLGREPSLTNRIAESPSIPGDQRKWAAIQKALRFCEANFRRGISHAEVGKAVGYSSRYLSQLMSAQLGHTLADHLQNLRINEGRRLLEDSDLSVGAIANAIGYEDPAHFSRAFSRHVGVSPRIYRRRLTIP